MQYTVYIYKPCVFLVNQTAVVFLSCDPPLRPTCLYYSEASSIIYSTVEKTLCAVIHTYVYLTVQYHAVSVRACFGYVVLDVLNLCIADRDRERIRHTREN